MKNELLYIEFIKNNPKDRNFLDMCEKYEIEYNKNVYDFTGDEMIRVLSSFSENEQKNIKRVCKKYIDFAYEEGFNKGFIINVIDMINTVDKIDLEPIKPIPKEKKENVKRNGIKINIPINKDK